VNLILCYLRGATDVGSVFDRDSGIGSSVFGYINSDYADNLIVTQGDIVLKKIVSEKNLMDMMTKSVLIFMFKRYLNLTVVYSL
jgi:hypothetical protein